MAFVPPDAEQVRALSGLDFADHGYPEAEPDPLVPRVESAVSYVEHTTGRKLDGRLPSEFHVLARDAVVGRVEQLVLSKGQTVNRALGDDIQSFRAGDYQETRRKLSEIREARLVNPWAELSEVLWLLMTPEKRAEFEARMSGVPEPAGAVLEVDWGAGFPPRWP